MSSMAQCYGQWVGAFAGRKKSAILSFCRKFICQSNLMLTFDDFRLTNLWTKLTLLSAVDGNGSPLIRTVNFHRWCMRSALSQRACYSIGISSIRGSSSIVHRPISLCHQPECASDLLGLSTSIHLTQCLLTHSVSHPPHATHRHRTFVSPDTCPWLRFRVTRLRLGLLGLGLRVWVEGYG